MEGTTARGGAAFRSRRFLPRARDVSSVCRRRKACNGCAMARRGRPRAKRSGTGFTSHPASQSTKHATRVWVLDHYLMRQVQQRQTVHELFLDDLGKSV